MKHRSLNAAIIYTLPSVDKRHRVVVMASQRTLPPLQNLSMSDMPGDVLQEIAEKMVDLENPGDVCAKWAQLCKVMKNGPPMCTNPNDGAWKRGCELLGLDEKPVDGKLKDKTWREVFNALCDDLHRLREQTRNGYKWYTHLLNEKQTGARGAVWLRRCAGQVTYEHIKARRRRGRSGMRPGIEAIVNPFGSRTELYDAMFNVIPRDWDLGNATTVAEAQAAFDAGADPDAAVVQQSLKERIEMVEFLVAAGANVDDCGRDGTTALIHASSSGRLELVKVLLAAGADPNARNNQGRTALINACQKKRLQVVRALLAAGAYADVRFNGEPALIKASAGGHLKIVRALLAAGAEVDARDSHGSTALIRSSGYGADGNVEVVRELISNGTDVNARENDGKTALMYASERGRVEVVRALLAAGADVNAILDQGGHRALMMAVNNGRVEVVRALLAAGAALNRKDGKGITPLMIAAFRGMLRIVRDLLEADADVLLRDNSGNDARKWAEVGGHRDLEDMLREEADAAGNQ